MRAAILATLLCLASVVLSADYLRVQRSVTLKSEPRGDGEILESLAPGTQLALLQDEQENGYYRVQHPATGLEGWVYRTFVRRFPGTIPVSGRTPSGPPPATPSGAVWFRFDRDFVERRFPGDLAFSNITFDGQWKASTRHSASCGGKDGEIHVGAYEGSLDLPSIEEPFSRVADSPTVAWGLVAEPPNTTPDDLDALKHLEGSRVSFHGYLRVWNEGHYDDEKSQKPGGSSNPNHVVELHPAWQLRSDDEEFEEYDFQRTEPMGGFAGYGLSKARPMLQAIQSGSWPKAYATPASVFLLLPEASNFYQLPVHITNVQTLGEGMVMLADVCAAVGCPGNQFIAQGLRLVARTASLTSQFSVGDTVEVVGIFSVNLGRALRGARTATTRAQAVSVGNALEFFVFARAGRPAVRNSKCDPEQ